MSVNTPSSYLLLSPSYNALNANGSLPYISSVSKDASSARQVFFSPSYSLKIRFFSRSWAGFKAGAPSFPLSASSTGALRFPSLLLMRSCALRNKRWNQTRARFLTEGLFCKPFKKIDEIRQDLKLKSETGTCLRCYRRLRRMPLSETAHLMTTH